MSENRVLQAASIREPVSSVRSAASWQNNTVWTRPRWTPENQRPTRSGGPKHGMEPLQATIQRSLQRTHERFGDDYYDGPTEVDEPLFNEIEPIKDDITYSIRFQPATAVNRTIILSKKRLGYRVRDDTHRYHLNLALDAGIGQRREHGFGFLNLRDKTPPRADT